MVSYYFISLLVILINVLTLSTNKLPSTSLQHNSLNRHKIVLRNKINSDMYRIKQILDPLRSLFNSRDIYRKHNNMLKTFWTCCPQQRVYLFDMRNAYHIIMGTDDCHNFIRDNRTRLTRQCQNNLKLFDPTRGDVQTCDGRLLRNLADKYVFVVELSNYTERWCIDGLYPMLIYSDINQILPCERAIRQGLRKDPQSYATYDALSSNILDVYVKNLHNYRDCSDPHFWDKEDDEEIDTSMPMFEYQR
ncbi:unnamed protein product [Rotaria sordida]|uniref:Uncharacterized protein n=1 Tax=Rotaria sordida TaxID=392033 RepID=A0A819F0N8_9BILA|nr:unnamed protein product [Rotaria sordida]CAF3859918.1 unnamed protein product [Rotaria sordida]